MQLERVTRVDAARMSTKVLDAARTNEEGGRTSSEKRRGVDGAPTSTKGLDAAQTSEEGGCNSNEGQGWMRLE